MLRNKKLFDLVHILAIVALVAVFATVFVACDSKDGLVRLSFETNGGGEQPVITVKGGGAVALPELEYKKEGETIYVFDGWSLNRDLSGKVYREIATAPTSDATFYAIWEKGYLLTLDVGSGQSPADSVYVKEGANLVDTLKKYAPTPKKGLVFDKWTIGDEDLDSQMTMPAAPTTVVAHYLVSYTVSYYLQQDDAQYKEDISRRQSKAGALGIQVSVDQPAIDGYTYNIEMSTDRIVLSDTAEQNAVKLYYDKNGYHAKYNPNPPAGTTAFGEMNETIASFDSTLTAAKCEFNIPGYRFLGWDDGPHNGTDGTPKFLPGDELDGVNKEDPDIALYAVWQKGIADALGGGDYLFFDPDNDNVIYLLRNGAEEKRGEYDSKTQIFKFVTDAATASQENIVISGMINGDYFYYFNETLYKTFKTTDGKRSISIKENYAATYTDESGTQKEGKVSFDTLWGYYIFTGDDVMLRFEFDDSSNGEKYIVIQNMDEAGYYATAEGYPVIYLDGFGGLKYYFDPEHPTYHDISNEGVLVADGFYTVNDKGYFECSTYVGDPDIETNRLEDFLFRIADGVEPGKDKIDLSKNQNFPTEFTLNDIKASAIERSAFYGQLGPELYLDGFGGGTYTEQVDRTTVEHVGTYDIIESWWMTLGTNESNRTWLINFKYEGAKDNIYFALTEDNRGRVTAQLFGIAPKGTESGLAWFDGPITLGGQNYDRAFIMFILDAPDTSMALVKMDEGTIRGETIDIFAPMYSGRVTAIVGQENTYHFESNSGEAQMNFKLTESTIANDDEKNGKQGKAQFSTASGEGSLDKRVIDESIQLTVDPSTSTANYVENGITHDNVPYTYSNSEFLEFYTFTVNEERNEYWYYYRDVDEEKFVRISGDRVLNYAYYTEDLFYAFPAMLLLTEGSNKAYIAVPMAVGEASYVGEGTYETVSDNEFKFTATAWVDNLIDYFGGDGFESSVTQFHEYYDSFTFRKVGGDKNTFGEFYARFDNMYYDLDNFKADGYSNNATYTLDNGHKLEGTFYMMEIIIVFESDEGVEYRLKVEYEGDTPINVKNVSSDAGLYYFYDIDDTAFETFGPEEGGTLYDYIVFDGDDKVTIARYNGGYVASMIAGTMTKTENWTEDFREYKIEEEEGETFFVVLGTFKGIWGDILDEEYLVYDVYNEAYNGRWETEDGGVLTGNGYRLQPASYDVDGDGEADYYGDMVRATFQRDDTTTHAYTVDANGEVIVFTYDIDLETSSSFVFNVVEDGNSYPHLVERKLRFGAYAYWELGKRPGGYMYLDGVGKAEIYDNRGSLTSTGSYGLDGQDSEYGEMSYWYKDDSDSTQDFHFALSLESESTGGTWFEYRRYTANVAGEYEADDWSHLSINSFGEITYTDRYGVVYEGYYEYDLSAESVITLYTFDGSGIVITFNAISVGGGSFDYRNVEFKKIQEEVPDDNTDTSN